MTQTIQQFVKSAGLAMTATRADDNPSMSGTGRDMDHWRCVLRAGRSRMTVPFSKGFGHHGERPRLCEVLDCMASDSAGLPLPEMAGNEDAAFAEWCGDYGYETDSRAALKTYRACLSQLRRLRRFLGQSAFNALLFETERE